MTFIFFTFKNDTDIFLFIWRLVLSVVCVQKEFDHLNLVIELNIIKMFILFIIKINPWFHAKWAQNDLFLIGTSIVLLLVLSKVCSRRGLLRYFQVCAYWSQRIGCSIHFLNDFIQNYQKIDQLNEFHMTWLVTLMLRGDLNN